MTTPNTSSLINNVFVSRKNILDLLGKQDYNIDEYAYFNPSEVNAMLQNKQLDMLLEKKENNIKTGKKDKIYVRYYLAKSLQKQNIDEMIDDLFNVEEVLTKNDTLFIIVKDDMNETLMNKLKFIWETDGIFIVVQNIKRLLFNILEHSLVPPHRIISDDELVVVKNRYNITDDQFPEISRFDPVAQVICIRPGQVCEIIRSSKTSISSVYYRKCI